MTSSLVSPPPLSITNAVNQTRFFSVKELPWCKPTQSRPLPSHAKPSQINHRKKLNDASSSTSNNDNDTLKQKLENNQLYPKFGIIAAIEHKSRLIGYNNAIPWCIPQDRAHFMNTTRDKIIIIGRVSFYDECTDFSHLSHVRHTIVLSTTMQEGFLSDHAKKVNEESNKVHSMHLARSFNEALRIAKTIQHDENDNETKQNIIQQLPKQQQNKEDFLDCWICGGPRVYEEAIRHPEAKEIQLTMVHTHTELNAKDLSSASFFPPNYLWDTKFPQVKSLKRDGRVVINQNDVNFSFHVYRKKMPDKKKTGKGVC